MMKNFILYISFIVGTISVTTGQTTQENINALTKQIEELDQQKEAILLKLQEEKLVKLRTDLDKFGLPKLTTKEKIVNHAAYSLVYSEFHEQAKWVAHIITPDIINGKQGRSNDFRPDPLIETGSAIEEDYFLKYLQPDSSYKYDGFGYDRGHLAPSADFRWSAKALSESYFYSNMSPQLPDFNRDKWADLEGLLRGYIYNNPTSQLYVVTGPILNKKLPHIERGTNKVTIPDEFFKVVIDLDKKEGIGFLMPNKKMHYPLSTYAKSIDEIEKISGIDFYHLVDDKLEEALESKFDVNKWVPKENSSDVSPIKPQTLPRDHFNSVQAKIYAGDNKKITVCGTIVSSKISRNGHIFMNVDKSFPNQLFTIAIWKKNHPNFSYDITEQWEGKQVCVTGKVIDFGGTPTMVLKKEDEIKAYNEGVK